MYPNDGGIAQLVERLVRNEKARGSNPLTSRPELSRPPLRRSGEADTFVSPRNGNATIYDSDGSFCATTIMLFQRKGNRPAPMNRTTRKPLSFNNWDRVLYDQNLM